MLYTVVIAGGHLSPAIAVIEELMLERKWDIHFFGRKHTFDEYNGTSFEYRSITKRGIPFFVINPPRLPHAISFPIFTFIYQLARCIWHIYWQVKQLKPMVIVSFGGYLGGAVSAAGWLAGIPVVIHEQTHTAGFANKLSAFIATSVLVAWDETVATFHSMVRSKIIVIGNPVRKELREIDKKTQQLTKSSVVYITGGSTGAHAINQLVAEILPELLARFRIIHQCGESQYHDYERLSEQKGLLPSYLANRYTLTKFINEKELCQIYARAAIIIGRAGANTVIELAVIGGVAILIPLPGARDHEQLVNAQTLERVGSALVVSQEGLHGNQLLKHINAVASHFSKYQKHAQTYCRSKEIIRHRRAAFLVSRAIAAHIRTV